MATYYPFPPLVDVTDPVVMRERMQACGIARSRGNFWLPCPLCGLEFGGHEWMRSTEEKPSSVHVDGDDPFTGTGICPFCTMAGRGADPRFAWIRQYPEPAQAEAAPPASEPEDSCEGAP